MTFSDELVDLLGHCCPAGQIELFAKKLEGEIVGYVEWRLGQARQEVTEAVETAEAEARPDAAAADTLKKAGK